MICDFGLARTVPETYLGPNSYNTHNMRTFLYQSYQGDILDNHAKKLVGLKLEQSKIKNPEAKRAMSTHVCSRWYRSPEVCILENHYDQASDIWSLGCCLYELMKVIDQD